MKKIFTLALASLAWMGSMNLFAQDEDMTNYIVNAGFDDDLTWTTSGGKKTKDHETPKSDRSIAYIATDGSRYATVNPSTPKSRADGRTFEATNGFLGMIQGWDPVWSSNEQRDQENNCEWVYFGVLPYGLGEQAVPVADDGTGYLAPPPTPSGFEGGTGALFLRAGWGGGFSYSQNVKLPCATYRLEYWTVNANPNTAQDASATDLSQIKCRRDVFKEEGGSALTATTWTKHEFEFTPTADFTITFGIKVSNNNSNQTPWMFIDGIKLYKIADADASTLIEADIYDTEGDLENLRSETAIGEYSGLYDEIDAAIDAADKALKKVGGVFDAEKAQQALNNLMALYTKLNEEVLPAMEELEAKMAQIDKLLSTTDYPGKSDLQTAVSNIQSQLQTASSDEFITLVASLDDAIQDYYMSQIGAASKSDPANVSYLVVNPFFTTTDNEPTIEYSGDAVTSCAYPLGTDESYRNGEGWYVGQSGGDQRTNTIGERHCWNAWRTGSWDVSINQDLTGLKNGWYKITAEMITQPDWVSNQHLFVRSSVGEVVSPNLTEGLWDSGQWTSLATDWIVVNDGTLTIGAAGSNTAGDSSQMGWFCVTNFRLLYGGEASDGDAQAIWQQTVNAARELADQIKFAADRSTFESALSSASTVEELNAAKTEAQNSINKYNAVMDGSYKDLKEGSYSGKAKEVADKVVGIMDGEINSSSATYTEMDAKTEVLREFRDAYLPALAEVEALNPTDATAKAALEQSLNDNLAQVLAITSLPETAQVKAWAADLLKVASVVEGSEALAGGSDDLSAFIINPTINGNTGWTINKPVGDGNGAKTGQQYDGDEAGGYLDSYNSEAGALQFSAYQVLNVPNGVYVLQAMMRASGTVGQEGVYLFAIDGTDPAKAVLAPAHIQHTSGTFTEEGDYTDSYGPIWEEAYAAVDQGTNTDEQLKITEANGGMGRGWFYVSLEVEVTNNILTVGVTNESERTNGLTDTNGDACVPFSGTWYSADNFSLTLKENKQPDYNPATGIENVEGKVAPRAIYNVAGQRLNKLQKGINIVDGKKVLVK